MSEYVDVRAIHAGYVLAQCRYEGCENERYITTSAAIEGKYTCCRECGPDVSVRPRARVPRIDPNTGPVTEAL